MNQFFGFKEYGITGSSSFFTSVLIYSLSSNQTAPSKTRKKKLRAKIYSHLLPPLSHRVNSGGFSSRSPMSGIPLLSPGGQDSRDMFLHYEVRERCLNLKLQKTGEVCPSMSKTGGTPFPFWYLDTSQPLSERRQSGKKVLPSASSLYRPHPWPLALLTPHFEHIFSPVPPNSQLPPRGFPHPAPAVESLSPTLFLTTVTPDGSLHLQWSRS